MTRRIIVSLFCITLVCAAFFGCGSKDDDADGGREKTDDGRMRVSASDFDFKKDPEKMCGDKLYWTVKDNTLLIAGEGDMDDYDRGDRNPPWHAYSAANIGKSEKSNDSAFESREFGIDDFGGDYDSGGGGEYIGDDDFGGDGDFGDPPAASEQPSSEEPAAELPPIYYIKMQDGITSVGNEAFCELYEVKGVYLSNTTKRIGDYAFASEECSPRRIDLPASVTEIGETAFESSAVFVEKGNRFYSSDEYGVLYNKDKTKILQFPWYADIRSYTVPATVTDFDISVYNQSLEELIFPDSLRTLPPHAVWDCENLRRVVLPQRVTELPERMLEHCNSLEEVVLPAALETIGADALVFCSSLKTLTLPHTLRSIGENAFDGCDALTLTFDGCQRDWRRIDRAWELEEKFDVLFTDPTDYFEYVRDAVVFADGGAALTSEFAATSEARGQLAAGETVSLLAINDARAYVERGDGARGWCDASALRFATENIDDPGGMRATVLLFGQSDKPVYAEPREGAAETDRLKNYAQISLKERVGGFYRVEYGEELYSYDKQGYITVENVWSGGVGTLYTSWLLRNTLIPAANARIDALVETVKPSKPVAELPDAEVEAFMTAAMELDLSLTWPDGCAQPCLRYGTEEEFSYWPHYGTMESLVAYCLNYYTPETTRNLLHGRLAEIDGKLCIWQMAIGDGPPVEHSYRVIYRTDDTVEVQVTFIKTYDNSIPDFYKTYTAVRGKEGFALTEVYSYWDG